MLTRDAKSLLRLSLRLRVLPLLLNDWHTYPIIRCIRINLVVCFIPCCALVGQEHHVCGAWVLWVAQVEPGGNRIIENVMAEWRRGCDRRLNLCRALLLLALCCKVLFIIIRLGAALLLQTFLNHDRRRRLTIHLMLSLNWGRRIPSQNMPLRRVVRRRWRRIPASFESATAVLLFDRGRLLLWSIEDAGWASGARFVFY